MATVLTPEKAVLVAATLMNPGSSRGHMVFKLTLEKSGGADGTKLHSEVGLRVLPLPT